MKPESSSYRVLGQLCTRITDGTHQTPNYQDRGVIFISAKNIKGGQLDFADRKYITREEHGFLTKSAKPTPGDLLLTKSGSLGDVAVIPELDFEFSIFESLALLKPRKDLVDSHYLHQYIRSPEAARYFHGITTGLAVKHLHLGDLRKLKVFLPPLERQREISEQLLTWDTAIQKTEQLIAAKERRLYFLYQKLFGIASHTRPGWISVRLAELLSPRKEHASPTDALPLYSLTIEDGITPKTDRYDREFLVKDTDTKQYAVVHPGDIVFNPSNLRWGAIARSRVDRSVVVSPIYEVLAIHDAQVSGALLAHELTSPRRIAYFATKTEGTLIERMAVKLDTFLRTEIHLPSNRTEQDTIAILLDEADHEIHLLRRRAEILSTQKRGLMQKLLTGQWRLPVHEETAKA
jgi:type I restriction enzyme S subunit